MTKEELKSQLKAKEDQMSIIRSEIKEIEQAYITEHRQFQDNDIVNVVDHKGNKKKGIVSGAVLDWDSKIEYKIKKIKKDGSVSSVNISVWGNDTIELA